MLDRAAEAARWDSFPNRREASAAEGLLRGIGIACYVESAGVAPSGFAAKAGARTGFYESATIRVEPDGGVQLLVGTHSHGQGHATSYAQILADRFGVPAGSITVLEGDTDQAPYGTGTFGSRSMAVGGSAIHRAGDRVIEKATLVAAYVLGVSAEQIEFRDGYFGTKGSNERLSFAEVARRACIPGDFPHDRMEPGLQATAVYDPPNFAFSNGAHVAEVEVSPETGVARVVGYCAIDDIGTVINPLIAEGQVHGGIAQGIGQALMEACTFDEAGQLVTGSFMDYALPRAGDLPAFDCVFDETQPCTHNPLGAKGCGEAGTIAAPAAVAGAILDALRPAGVTDLAMPFTPHRIWHALQTAGRSTGRGA
jgi:carbon-monoxide dehydrogenase large subunit